jgi:CBS domain-containing protein
MFVREMLNTKGRHVVTTRSDASITTVIHKLTLERIGALVVSDDGEHVDGIVSERDIVRALSSDGASILGPARRVSEIMTHAVQTCSPTDSVKDLMERMTRLRIRHLPVMEHGKLAGIISIGDVVKNRIEEVTVEAEILREAYIAAH